MTKDINEDARGLAYNRALYAYEGETNIALGDTISPEFADYSRGAYEGFKAGFSAGYASAREDACKAAGAVIEEMHVEHPAVINGAHLEWTRQARLRGAGDWR